MGRIQEIAIIQTPFRLYVRFRDEIDIAHNLRGHTYSPSKWAFGMLRRVAWGMSADIDLDNGIITLSRRTHSQGE